MTRFSIGLLMVIAAVVAIDCAIARSTQEVSSGGMLIWLYFVFGSLPMMSLLLVDLLRLTWAAWKRESIPPHRRGFQVGGWGALSLYTLWIFMSPSTLDACAQPFFGPMRTLAKAFDTNWWGNIFCGLALPLLVLPQLLLALLGGWAFGKLDSNSPSRPIPSRSEGADPRSGRRVRFP